MNRWVLALAAIALFAGCSRKEQPSSAAATARAMAAVNEATPASDPSLPSAATVAAADAQQPAASSATP